MFMEDSITIITHLNPLSTFISDDFPAPEGPMMAAKRPELNEPETSWRMHFVPCSTEYSRFSNVSTVEKTSIRGMVTSVGLSFEPIATDGGG